MLGCVRVHAKKVVAGVCVIPLLPETRPQNTNQLSAESHECAPARPERAEESYVAAPKLRNASASSSKISNTVASRVMRIR